MVKIFWFDNKVKAQSHAKHVWIGLRFKRGKKRIELRNGACGVSMLLIISTPRNHPKWGVDRTERYPVSMSMNGTAWISPEFARELADVIETGRKELQRIMTIAEIEAKGTLLQLVRRQRKLKRNNS